MSIPYIEILKDSREIDFGRTSLSQQIVIEFELPKDEMTGELEEPTFPYAEFMGATDDVLATEVAYDLIPLARFLPGYNGEIIYLILDSVKLTQVTNYDRWRAVASYKFDLNQGLGNNDGPETDSDAKALPYIQIGFAVGNQTRHITESLTTPTATGTSTDPRPLPNTGKAIGVTADGVEGADIAATGLTLQVTAYFYPAAVNFDFISMLKNAAAHTNTNVFLGQLQQEVLFLGANGSRTVTDIIPITFDFLCKPSVVNQPDAPFPNLTMLPHDLLDYRYSKQLDENAKQLLQKPDYRYIHHIYESYDFDNFGFPTS